MSGSSLIDRRADDADSLDRETLEAIQLAVAERLRRRHHQAPSFAVETAEEMVNQAYVEEHLEKSPAEREQVRNLPGLLVTAAVHRSIDKARREGREVYGEGAQAAIDRAEDYAPSTEALALRGIEAADLYAAVADLHHEQRQALSLLFWEELSVRQAAERMGIGAQTVVRRRDQAMDALRLRFGIDADDPLDTQLGREAGYFAYASLLIGAGSVNGVGDQLAASADAARHGIEALWTRAKELTARFTSTGGETIGSAVSNGTAGAAARAGGGIVACLLVGGTIVYCGSQIVGGGGDSTTTTPQPKVTRRADPRPAPVRPVETNRKAAPTKTREGDSRRRGAERKRAYQRRTDSRGRHYTKAAERAARSQRLEGSVAEPAPESEPAPAPEPEPAYVGEPEGGGSSSATSAADEQFGLP